MFQICDMKIIAVSNRQISNNNRIVPNLSSSTKGLKNISSQDKDNIRYTELNYYSYNLSNIKFTGKFIEKYPKHWLRGLLKLGLPCPCCGKLMPELNEIKSLPSLGALHS